MSSLEKKYDLFINGEFVKSSSNETIDVFNPSNGKMLSTITDATKDDVDNAVKAARKAFNKFKHSTVNERSIILNKKLILYMKTKNFWQKLKLWITENRLERL